VGGTEVTFEPWDVAVAVQQNTAIGEPHRGIGMAKWVKASMLDRIRRERPEVERVRTSNAFSNTPMLAINSMLGFKIIGVRTEWQGQMVTCAAPCAAELPAGARSQDYRPYAFRPDEGAARLANGR
jgi:hypothetical protein